jgi:hypothetical protein
MSWATMSAKNVSIAGNVTVALIDVRCKPIYAGPLNPEWTKRRCIAVGCVTNCVADGTESRRLAHKAYCNASWRNTLAAGLPSTWKWPSMVPGLPA